MEAVQCLHQYGVRVFRMLLIKKTLLRKQQEDSLADFYLHLINLTQVQKLTTVSISYFCLDCILLPRPRGGRNFLYPIRHFYIQQCLFHFLCSVNHQAILVHYLARNVPMNMTSQICRKFINHLLSLCVFLNLQDAYTVII